LLQLRECHRVSEISGLLLGLSLYSYRVRELVACWLFFIILFAVLALLISGAVLAWYAWIYASQWARTTVPLTPAPVLAPAGVHSETTSGARQLKGPFAGSYPYPSAQNGSAMDNCFAAAVHLTLKVYLMLGRRCHSLWLEKRKTRRFRIHWLEPPKVRESIGSGGNLTWRLNSRDVEQLRQSKGPVTQSQCLWQPVHLRFFPQVAQFLASRAWIGIARVSSSTNARRRWRSASDFARYIP